MPCSDPSGASPCTQGPPWCPSWQPRMLSRGGCGFCLLASGVTCAAGSCMLCPNFPSARDTSQASLSNRSWQNKQNPDYASSCILPCKTFWGMGIQNACLHPGESGKEGNRRELQIKISKASSPATFSAYKSIWFSRVCASHSKVPH